MGKFFDQFPKVLYDTEGTRSGSYDVLTNIFVRIGIFADIKNNNGVYYPYLVQEGDTPEMIADKYYGDSQFHWVVLMMNDIVDPFYDWPLDSGPFNKYITTKYGSTDTAQSQIHHYEKQIVRLDSASQVSTTSKMVIDANTYTELASSTFNTYDLSNGTTVQETVTKNAVTCWTWELEQNENKRSIKLLKKEYIEQVKQQFESIMQATGRVTPSVITPNIDS